MLASCLLLTLGIAPVLANARAGSSDSGSAAKSSGKVWGNTESGVYHKNGRCYDKTKAGKFMTGAEAKTAGYKEAQR
jgi:hypothetical protein